MIVSRKNNQLIDFNVKINGKTITRTTCVKYLGVFIDDKLTCSNHIAYLENKLSRSDGFFYRIRQYLSDTALKSLSFSFVYSHLQFAIGAWGGVGITASNQLNVLHNKIIRAMTYSSFRTKVTPLFKKLNLLKLDDIYSLALGNIMHKFHSGNLTDNFNRLFTPVNQVHCHATRSATKGAYFWQMAHTNYGKRSLKHLGPKIWDNINPSLHDSSPLTFKKQYRDVRISALDDR